MEIGLPFEPTAAGRWSGLRRRLLGPAVGLRVLSLLAALLVWQGLSLVVGARFIPGPGVTFAELWRLVVSGEVWGQFLITLERMGISFALAMAGGIAVGTLMGLYGRAEKLLDLWITVGLAIPGLCYVIIAFMWLGLNDRAAVLAIALSTFPAIAINVWQGTKAIDQGLVDMSRVFGASAWRRATRVVFPQVLPYVMAAARSGVGVVWKVTVVVELLGRSNGIGYQLNYNFQVFDMAGVFAWTLFFTLVMIVIEIAIMKPVEGWLFRWRPAVRG
ncbi:MAG TPA: ABC transporter permease [Candidatus Dormibacteraeota bacterium]|nr:ABC transporter permease [Candidatus Dormibacteraeota bacterium]